MMGNKEKGEKKGKEGRKKGKGGKKGEGKRKKRRESEKKSSTLSLALPPEVESQYVLYYVSKI